MVGTLCRVKLVALCGYLFALVIASVLSAEIAFSAETHLSITPAAVSQMTPEGETQGSGRTVAYQLPPEKEQTARSKYLCIAFLYFFGVIYQLAVLLFILNRKWIQKMRDRAEGLHVSRWGQSWSVIPGFWLVYWLLLLPLNVGGYYMAAKYVPGTLDWGNWCLNQVWDFLGALVAFPILGWMIYALIEKSPRRWWLYVVLSTELFGAVFLYGAVFGLGNEFFALSQEHPELAGPNPESSRARPCSDSRIGHSGETGRGIR